MKTSFQLAEHQIKVESLYFEGLFSDLWEANRQQFNEFSKGSVQRFTDKLSSLWGYRKWAVLNAAPIVREDEALRDYSNLIIGAAWLDSSSRVKERYSDGSHAFVVWIQKPDIEISVQKALNDFKWENIAEDYEL
jgi:hypothetical protein